MDTCRGALQRGMSMNTLNVPLPPIVYKWPIMSPFCLFFITKSTECLKCPLTTSFHHSILPSHESTILSHNNCFSSDCPPNYLFFTIMWHFHASVALLPPNATFGHWWPIGCQAGWCPEFCVRLTHVHA